MPPQKPIQILNRDHVGTVLRGRGFRRSGGTFRHIATNGDVAVISIRGWRLMQAELEFFVEMGVVTKTMLDYRAHLGEDVRPERVSFVDTYGTWSTRMRDPRLGTVMDDLWQFDLEDDAAMQLFLSTLDAAATDLLALTDRQRLIETLRHPAPGVQMMPSRSGLAMALADEGRSPELDGLLEELRESGQQSELATWLETRANSNG